MATQNAVGVGFQAQRHGFEDRVTKALAGVEQYLPAATSLVLNGKSMTQPEIVKALQDILQLFKTLRDARKVAKEQLKVVRNELVPGHALYTALERAAQAYFGKGSPALAQFGFPLGNRKPRTAATNIKAQAKSQLTRALRHTMGRKQKAAIQSAAPSVVTVDQGGKVQPGSAAADNATGGSEIIQPTRSAAGVAAPVLPSDSASAGGAQGTVK
jgi:hypothetical protein